MEILLQFEHRYEVDQIRETSGLSGRTRKLFYPGASEAGGRDGVLLRIAPMVGDTWVGSFAPGYVGRNFLNQVLSCPNPNEVCVISSGAGYIVRTDAPSNWKSVRSIPVCDARAILDKRLLVLSDFTKLVAYGVDGLEWESPKVSSDGIQITDIMGGHLTLVGWDAAQQKKVRVSVNLNDGTVVLPA
jgi:hypothetical protein